MAKTLFNIRRETELMEKLRASDPTGKWISDFVHSDNPKFAGKSKKERIRMALGASYGAKNEAKDSREYDYEGDMAKSQLRAIIANAQQVHDMLEDNTNMAEWVQSKITLAADYISTVADYMMAEVKEEFELDEAIKLGAKVMIHAPGKSYHGKTGRVGEIRHGAFKGAAKTYTVDHDSGSIQLDKKNIKLQSEEVQIDELALKPEHRAAIRRLRPSGEHSKTMLTHDSGKQIHVTREGDKVHLVTHEIGAGTGKKTTMNYSHFDESAWGQNKLANLQAAHARHSEKAIAANKAGDHEAVKVHMRKMNMVKNQMNKIKQNEDVKLDESKHRVSVTVSQPDHTMVTKRKEQQQKFVRVSGDREGAVARAQQHFKKQGYRVHGAEYVGAVNEHLDLDEAGGMKSAALVKAMLRKQKHSATLPPEKQEKQRQEYQDKKQNEDYYVKVNNALKTTPSGAHIMKFPTRDRAEQHAKDHKKRNPSHQVSVTNVATSNAAVWHGGTRTRPYAMAEDTDVNEMSNVVFDNSGERQGVTAGSIKATSSVKPAHLIKPEKDAASRARSLKHKEKKMKTEAKSLYDRHQELRKKSGLPDPSHYLKLAKQKQAEIDAMKADQGSTERLHTAAPEPHPGAQKTFTALRNK